MNTTAHSSKPWLEELQSDALARFRADGPPTRRREAWRFTPFKPLIESAFEIPNDASDDSVGWALAALGEDAAWQVPIVNGRARLVNPGEAPAGIEIARVAELDGARAEGVRAHLGRVDRGDDVAALNAAMFDDGLVLFVREGADVELPIHLLFVGTPEPEAVTAYPRVLILAGPRSRAHIVESYMVRPGGRHLTNAVTEVVVGRGASLAHTRTLFGAPEAYHVGRLAVRQDADSAFRSHVATLGGALSRLDARVELAGKGAEASLQGVYHAGDREHVDHHLTVVHEQPYGSSQQTYRGILDGSGKAVFDGTAVVAEGAVKTSAHQQNRNLLLSDRAEVHAKPHLRISNDDVQCSHGATVGALDEEQLFYLRSRGVGAEQAAAMLTYGFVRELLAEIPDLQASKRAIRALLDRLPQGREIEEDMS